jgi:hypothetical protein
MQRQLRDPVTMGTRRPSTVSAHAPPVPRPGAPEPHPNLVLDPMMDLARAEMRFAAQQSAAGPGMDGPKPDGTGSAMQTGKDLGIPTTWQPTDAGSASSPLTGDGSQATEGAVDLTNPGWVPSQPVHSSLDPLATGSGHDPIAPFDPMAGPLPGPGLDPFDPGGGPPGM